MQYSTVQYSTVKYSTVQCDAVQYSTVQYSTIQNSTIQYSTEVKYEDDRYLLLVLLILLIPLPVILNVDPGCVPGLIFIVTAPSKVLTSAEEPNIA